jgi:hypothetical protein
MGFKLISIVLALISLFQNAIAIDIDFEKPGTDPWSRLNNATIRPLEDDMLTLPQIQSSRRLVPLSGICSPSTQARSQAKHPESSQSRTTGGKLGQCGEN